MRGQKDVNYRINRHIQPLVKKDVKYLIEQLYFSRSPSLKLMG